MNIRVAYLLGRHLKRQIGRRSKTCQQSLMELLSSGAGRREMRRLIRTRSPGIESMLYRVSRKICGSW